MPWAASYSWRKPPPRRSRTSNTGSNSAGRARLLDQGRLVPATDYIDAQRLRRKLSGEFDQLWVKWTA